MKKPFAVLVFGRNGITQEVGKIENRADWGKTGFIDFAAVYRRLVNDGKLAAFPDGIDIGRELLRRSHVLIVCGDEVDESVKNDIAVAQRLGITATTLDGILKIHAQGENEVEG